MTAVAAAAVTAAGMTFFMMVLTVMVALNIGIVEQIAGNQCFHSSIGTAGNTAEEPDAGCCQSHLGTAADTAADQNICLESRQNACQSAVAAAVGIHNLGSNDLAVEHIIDLKLLGVAKVLENFTVFISYRDSHIDSSFQRYVILLL